MRGPQNWDVAAWSLAATIAALVVAPLVAWVWRTHRWRLIRESSAPVTVVYTDETTGLGLPWVASVPNRLGRPDLLDAPGKREGSVEPAALLAWLRREHRAYDVGRSELRMVWANRTAEPILIDGVSLHLISKHDRLHDTLFENPSGGAEPRIEFGFDLDHPESTPVWLDADGTLKPGGPRFAHEAISINPGQQQPITISGEITKGDCEWEIELHLVIGKSTLMQRIGDPYGQPIRTAAARSEGRYPSYWVTGLAQDCDDAQSPPYLHNGNADLDEFSG